MDKTQIGYWRFGAEVLRLEAGDNAFAWRRLRRIRCHAERTDRPELFSRNGIGAEGWQFQIRAQDIRVTDMIRMGGEYYFPTRIVQTPERLGFLTVSAAKVQLRQCLAAAGAKTPGPAFPAVLTEKYLRHEQEIPEAVNVLQYVLVTPKAIELQCGSIVAVDGEAFEVLVAHRIDTEKNEFEILRKADL